MKAKANVADKIELLTSPEGYFRELVQKGLSSRKVQTYPVVETYLVSMLQHYLDSRNLFEEHATDGAERVPQTLAETFLIAQNADPIQKAEMLSGSYAARPSLYPGAGPGILRNPLSRGKRFYREERFTCQK